MTSKCYDLHLAALNGDDEAVIRALETAADVNVLDEEGRTPIMCAVAGDRWQEVDASDASFMTPKRLNAIRIMLRRPQITLHCLNAPHATTNGVIPLSMAAWLNFPQLVELLLEESADTVAVDGLDAHGATALMYASRDNSLQVVRLLLSHGARPDLRDCNFRSSIQYAIPHPQVLWLCETVLRRHRWRESQSTGTIKLSINACSESTVEELLSLAQCSLPSLSRASSNTFIEPPPLTIFAPAALSRSVKTLLSTLTNPPDISFLRSLLFSPALSTSSPPALYPLSVPILVNRPDERGWSAIHHACSFTISGSSSSSKTTSPEGRIPEIEVLDILYLAGADMSLFTSEEHHTPLHILVKTSASVPSTISPVAKDQIRDFITHLVRDLGAPLGARDKHDETCLHIAAEHGAHKVVMDVLLDLDRVLNDGRVSKMKNARGLLAINLAAKPELLDSFTAMKEKMDIATIRRGSVSSALSDNTIRGSEKHASLTAVIADELGVALAVPMEDAEPSDPLDIDPVEKTQALLAYMRAPIPTQNTLDQMESITDNLVKYFLAKITAAKKEVDNVKRKRETARASARTLGASLSPRSQSQSTSRMLKKKKSWRPRESEDSQMTRVSSSSEVNVGYANVGTQTGVEMGRCELVGTIRARGYGHGHGWVEWFEGLIHSEDPGTVWKKRKEKKEKKTVEWEGSFGEFGCAEKLKGEKEKEKGAILGAHRLKNWWKKMTVVHDHRSHSHKAGSVKSGSNERLSPSASTTKLEIVRDIQDPTVCLVGREHKLPGLASHIFGSLSSIALSEGGDGQVSSQTFVLEQRGALVLAEHAERQGEWMIGKALRTAPIVLGAVRKDLERIEVCLVNAEEYLKGAEASVERVGRVLKRAQKKRQAAMDNLTRSRTTTPTPFVMRNISQPRISEDSPTSTKSPSPPGSPGYLGYSLSLSLRPSYSSIASVASDSSIFTTTSDKTTSNVTFSSHHYHPVHGSGHSQDMNHYSSDDDETRTMRRLLSRRIEAQLRAAYEEVDRVVNWISIVQDVVGGVKRRTYL